MKAVLKASIPWLVLATIWLICYIVTGSVAFATTLAGLILFIALIGLLYT